MTQDAAPNPSERKLPFNCFLQLPSHRCFTVTNCFPCKCPHTARLQVRIDILQYYPETERGRALLALMQQGSARRPRHSVLGGFSLLAISKFNRPIITGCWPDHSSGKWHQHFPEVQQKIVQGISQQTSHFEMNLGCNDHHFQTCFLSGSRRETSRFSPVCPLPS